MRGLFLCGYGVEHLARLQRDLAVEKVAKHGRPLRISQGCLQVVEEVMRQDNCV